MSRPRLILLDLDGTVYRGSEPIPGAAETIAELRRRGVALRFVTNNSSVTAQSQQVKLEQLGVPCKEADILTSGLAAARYLAREGLTRAFVMGERGLAETLISQGVEPINLDNSGRPVPVEAPGADVVLAGICRHFDYAFVDAALQLLLAGAKFVATNPDPTYPIEGGKLQPGAGAIVGALRGCSGREPIVIGKPEPAMIEICLRDAQVAPEEALVVGDRMDTDIEAGRRAGCPTWLVLSGATASLPAGQPGSPDLLGLLSLM